MDMKSTLVPLQELQARKARDLRKRGYTDAQTAETMGISKAQLADLLPPNADPEPKKKPPSGPSRR